MKLPPIDLPRAKDLPTDVETLQAMIIDLQGQVAYLSRMLFGRRSEKVHHDYPGQGLLFGMIEPQAEPSPAEAEADEAPRPQRPRRSTKSHGRQPLPAHLMRCVHDIYPATEDQSCPCCGQGKKVFGCDVTEQLEMIPPKYFVNQFRRHKMACPHCQGSVSQGPLPPCPIHKGIPGPTFLADLLVSKYVEHVPLYRLERRYLRWGLELNRSTLGDWVSHSAGALASIVKAMHREVRGSPKIHTDDTGIVVLDPSVKPASRRGYMWVYIDIQGDVVFDYTRSHNRLGPATFLEGWSGYLQADGLSVYDSFYVGKLIWEVACWAHTRRKFYDALVHYPVQASRVLQLIARLYAVESRAKALKVEPEKLLAWRQRFSRRRLARLHSYLTELSLQVLPKSSLGKALAYALKNWKALNRYTEASFLEIDNNRAERRIKDLVLGRKNWLFAGSEAAAENTAVLFSLVASCKLAGVDPLAYLKDVLVRVHSYPEDRMHELIPRHWKVLFGTPEACVPAVA